MSKTTDLDKIKAKLVIDEYASKAARWAGRWNAALPLVGGRVGEHVMHTQWAEMGEKLAKMFDISTDEGVPSRSFASDASFVLKYLRSKELKYIAASTIPDFGLITSSVVRDSAREMTKIVGWTYFCLFEGVKNSGRKAKLTDFHNVEESDLKKAVERARIMKSSI